MSCNKRQKIYDSDYYDTFIEATLAFEDTNRNIVHKKCSTCCCVSLNLQTLKKKDICIQCNKRKSSDYYLKTKQLPIWISNDGITQFSVPEVLTCLTLAEKLLIQKYSPFVPLQHIHQGVLGIKGHVCAFEQDIPGLCCILPRLPSNVDIIRIVREMKSEIGKSLASLKKTYLVNKKRILSALLWLKTHNKEYQRITIDVSNLDWIAGEEQELLPLADITDDDMYDQDHNQPCNTDFGPSGIQPIQHDIQEFGFVDSGEVVYGNKTTDTEVSILQKELLNAGQSKNIVVNWPALSERAVSEYSGKNIFAGAFPWLFPGGYGDINETSKESERTWGRRMLQYQDSRFMKDPVFTFFANNYITRQLNSSSGKWFVESFQDNSPETIDDLKESIQNGDYNFVNSLTYYSKRVKGSSQYWFQKRSELYAWVNHHVEAGNGAPSFFITLSCAEHYWPDIIRLIKERMDIAETDSSMCYLGSPKLPKILNEYCCVVQEFFQIRVENWFQTVGKQVFNINHYWARYEFAPGRGQIHAHVLGISSDKRLHNLTNIQKQDAVAAQHLGDYLREKYGFTAKLEELSTPVTSSPVAKRFSEIPKSSRTQDSQELLTQLQIHKCSRFCMRKGVCKIGCGKEIKANSCETPGFALNKCDSIQKDHRGITKIFLTRNHKRLNQTSTYALQSWRANCDIQVLLYKGKPGQYDISEISNVVDYVVAYSCKGNATLKEELTQTRNIVMNSENLTGCQRDIHRICKHALNRVVSSRLISKQEATVMLVGLPFVSSTETVESVSVSTSRKLAPKTDSYGSNQILSSYQRRLTKISDQSSPEAQLLHSMSLYDYFHFLKNVLPPQKKLCTIQHFLEMHKSEAPGRSLMQFYISLRYKKHPKASAYIIPNFVGIQSRPCYPISQQYARSVITIYKPWTIMPSASECCIHEFYRFINCRYCPKSVKMGYFRVLNRHLNNTTFLQPIQTEVDHRHNPVQECDAETIDLMGLQQADIDDGSDEYDIKNLPKGEQYKWDKTPTVRSFICFIDFHPDIKN